jgi:hypothetical protein
MWFDSLSRLHASQKAAQQSLGYAADISSASAMQGHDLQKPQKAIA